MIISKALQGTLATFQLNNPDASREQLVGHLKDIAENILATQTHRDQLEGTALVYSDLRHTKLINHLISLGP
ncbi:hypothetical protein [Aquipseudomonas alcaligenes]|uniref:hypothetical protein n=1 Tax=Aquipseudomonas alcaligenes TaxID=43263 RepID=UPI00242D7DCF|nr:hypothetical protein [Pseudomonas alcaligenes]